MSSENKSLIQPGMPADWLVFYQDLQNRGRVPDASSVTIGEVAVFRSMFINVQDVKDKLLQSGRKPSVITVYTDVLLIPDLTNWMFESAALVIFARHIEVCGSAKIILDHRLIFTAQVTIFAAEIAGSLTVSVVKSNTARPSNFSITQDMVSPGISIKSHNGMPVSIPMNLDQGLSIEVSGDMMLYLDNAFIFGSLLYEEEPELALSIFLWIKGWAALSRETEALFYRSTTLSNLLRSQIIAAANGALFVPQLTADVYTMLVKAFATEASKYESNYLQLYTQKVLTDENIVIAKTMVANSESETEYVSALLNQANTNYSNAEIAASNAQRNFNAQKITVSNAQADFEKIGIPEYQKKQTVDAMISLLSASVIFGAAIGAMAVGDEAAAPAAADGAIGSANAVVEAVDVSSEIAKMAKNLANSMSKLKELTETLQGAFELAQAVKEVSENLDDSDKQMKTIQDIQEATNGADLSACDGWAVYKIEVDNILQDPVDLNIGYALDYKESLDILIVYGQSLAGAQLAVIKAGQEVAALTFQTYYTRQKQKSLQDLVDSLEAGEVTILSIMQQFYQKLLDAKSSLFSALKSYQASYFYWAFRASTVQPKIIDSINDLSSGIEDITQTTMDTVTALDQFSTPPQQMKNIIFEVTDPLVIRQLQTTGQATWILPLESEEFAGLDRVRISTVRVWLEGTTFRSGNNNSLNIIITTAGNYFDRYQGTNYQFTSKPLARLFEYTVVNKGLSSAWTFENNSTGCIQIDGAVDKEVEYAYFQPTPFSEWTISLLSNNKNLDYSCVNKITMYFEGTAIGSDIINTRLITPKLNYA